MFHFDPTYSTNSPPSASLPTHSNQAASSQFGQLNDFDPLSIIENPSVSSRQLKQSDGIVSSRASHMKPLDSPSAEAQQVMMKFFSGASIVAPPFRPPINPQVPRHVPPSFLSSSVYHPPSANERLYDYLAEKILHCVYSVRLSRQEKDDFVELLIFRENFSHEALNDFEKYLALRGISLDEQIFILNAQPKYDTIHPHRQREIEARVEQLYIKSVGG